MTQIVAVDIGGTHARFAIARLDNGRVSALDEPCTFRTADHASLESAWEAFARLQPQALPADACFALAAPTRGELLKLTNNPWTIRPASLRGDLGVRRYRIINDFGAVAHAVSQLDEVHFRHLCGPEEPLPQDGAISIVGPGTGLGVAQLLRREGRYHVIETEGGHIDFAPLDTIEDRILAQLRERYRRVSVERIVSGMGLANIHGALAAMEGRMVQSREDKDLWADAIAESDRLAATALDRFCLSLGSVAGDIALAQGASAVVIAGGIGLRLAGHLPRSGFRDRFVAKGRYERRMDAIPVKIITHEQPGLYGAAAAFAEAFCRAPG